MVEFTQNLPLKALQKAFDLVGDKANSKQIDLYWKNYYKAMDAFASYDYFV